MEMLVEAPAAQTQDEQTAQPAWPDTQDSPFPDGYDIEAERVNLKDMLERWNKLAPRVGKLIRTHGHTVFVGPTGGGMSWAWWHRLEAVLSERLTAGRRKHEPGAVEGLCR